MDLNSISKSAIWASEIVSGRSRTSLIENHPPSCFAERNRLGGSAGEAERRTEVPLAGVDPSVIGVDHELLQLENLVHHTPPFRCSRQAVVIDGGLASQEGTV